MEISSRFQPLQVNENQMSLLLESNRCEAIFPVRSLLWQFKVGDLYLLIAEADPTILTIAIIDSSGKLLQMVNIGHWYYDAVLENVHVSSESTIEFEFGASCKVEVLNPSQVIKNGNEYSYLRVSGVPLIV